jgi:cellulose synthase/poly-beta-1,6-N-acetylglucosamine synthase-like glycosyltransferase
VVVVDDGSTDGTAEIVEAIATQDERVTLVRKSNGGKADALNTGLRYVTTEVVVVVDADTIILTTTVARLVAPFADPGVDAVCGNVQVGNVRNFLTVVQDVEYVTCQNYDRRAFDALNCIGVVPGATGAWRIAAVRAVGGYSHDTLTEDADLTIAVLRNGGRIVYAPDAKSKTEVPETFGALYKQRFRWAYGTFQTLWKHRGAFGRGTLGWVGMPNHVVFQVLFPMLAPTGDAVLLYSVVTGRWGAVAWGYLMFIGMDLLGSGIALRLDGRSLWSLWVVLVQRFCHRQFMYFVTFSAALACVRGGRHGWNKLERRASVEAAEA